MPSAVVITGRTLGGIGVLMVSGFLTWQVLDYRENIGYFAPELQKLKSASKAPQWFAIEGLKVQELSEATPVRNQSTVRVTTTTNEGRHFLAWQSSSLDRNIVYRASIWIKVQDNLQLQIEARDGVNRSDGKPANYGTGIFDPVARNVVTSSGDLRDRGIDSDGADQWQKVWVELPSADGELVVVVHVRSSKPTPDSGAKIELTLGGVEITSRTD
jgi:hypothetical protein